MVYEHLRNTAYEHLRNTAYEHLRNVRTDKKSTVLNTHAGLRARILYSGI